ncbi:hypothetical protein PVAND_015511 [Polypedilum vanderplanki]|uniref:Phospholipid/glycerol acyltransferase domain-containing protein n=1 Tax=Polypedilum vanderplanki TaxID=319348 RepID=A0A9J6BCF9_POLVA|nr:hypothetical protein PVAND_015511 [Polypedilum vanderplanki]
MFNKISNLRILGQFLLVSIFLTSGLFLNFIQILLHVFVKPLNRHFFNNWMNFISWTFWAQITFIYDFWSKSELIIYCKDEDFEFFGNEHNLALLNHKYEIDWLIAFVLSEKFKVLGSIRAFAKNAIKYIPICGWFCALNEQIFLHRSFDKDKKTIEDKLHQFIQDSNFNWIILFAEGTRFTKEKHKISLQFGKEKKLEPLKYHLIPRSRGFNLCVSFMKKLNCKAIYNLQLAFDKNSKYQPNLSNLLLGKKVIAHLYIERIPLENVEPTFEYLYEIYKTKDELHESFEKFGNFFEGRKLKSIEGRKIKPNWNVFINTIVWGILIISLALFYVIKLILAQQYLLIAIISIINLILVLAIQQNIVQASKINEISN